MSPSEIQSKANRECLRYLLLSKRKKKDQIECNSQMYTVVQQFNGKIKYFLSIICLVSF